MDVTTTVPMVWEDADSAAAGSGSSFCYSAAETTMDADATTIIPAGGLSCSSSSADAAITTSCATTIADANHPKGDAFRHPSF